jgi:AcrR family transcriptional regulator
LRRTASTRLVSGTSVAGLPSIRRAGKQRRRAPEIIDAAARVFAERGFHGATTQDIADVLGIRQASLYYYFSSKEAALELVCLKGVEGFFDAAKAIASQKRSARERLSLMIQSHLSPLVDRGNYVKVFLKERQHLPSESRHRIGRWSRGLERIFEQVIRDGVESGEFRDDLDVRLTALAALGMCNAVASWYEKENRPAAEVAAEFSGIVLDGAVRRRPAPRG